MSRGERNMKKTVFSFVLAAILVLATISTARPELRCGWWVDLSDKPKLQTWATDYGLNFVHLNWALDGYIEAPAWYSIANIRAFLDEAQKYGIVSSISISRVAFGGVNDTVFSTFVNGLKDHPALWGWYIGDEPELYSGNHQNLQHYYPLCKQLDPAHVAWIVNSVKVATSYADVTDLYAINMYPRSSSSLEFGDLWLRQSYDFWKTSYDLAKTNSKLPFLILPQGMGAGYLKYGDMTINELRYHVFTIVVQGIDKILLWTHTESNDTMKARGNQTIKQIMEIKGEMENGTTNSGLTVSQPATNLTYRYGVKGTSHVILAVNIANRGSASGLTLSNVRFTLPTGIRPSQVEVLNEGRTLPVTNGVFTDTFSKFAVHVYRFVAGTAHTLSAPTGLRVVDNSQR